MSSINKTARFAGLCYLLVAIFSGFAAATRASLIIQGDAAVTASKISASVMLFRIEIVSDLIGQIFHVLLAFGLYQLLKSINKNFALLTLILGLIPVPIAMLNQLNQIAALQLLGSTNFQQIMLYLNQFTFGVLIAQIFWGLWLFPLGFLAFKTNYIPKILGIFLIVAGMGYCLDSFGKILFPSYMVTISVYTFLGEVLFLFWLIIKGVKN